MKNYTYEQFLQLYDYANEKVREQIQKNTFGGDHLYPRARIGRRVVRGAGTVSDRIHDHSAGVLEVTRGGCHV